MANSYKGTVTGVKINGTTKSPSSGVVDLGTVITSHQDISGKQDKLVSGTNIKTINGASILGSGNITISGGGGSSSGVSGAYPEVDGSIYKQEDMLGNWYSTELTPNTFYVFPECGVLDVFLGPQMAGIANEYLFQFTSGSEPTSLILPDDIKWTNGEAPVIEANKIYQISILKGLGSVLEFDNAPSKITNTIKREGSNLVFDYPVASDVTVVFYGRSANAAQSSPPTTITLVYSTGEQSKAIGTLFNFETVTPSEDDTYIYTF